MKYMISTLLVLILVLHIHTPASAQAQNDYYRQDFQKEAMQNAISKLGSLTPEQRAQVIQDAMNLLDSGNTDISGYASSDQKEDAITGQHRWKQLKNESKRRHMEEAMRSLMEGR